MGQICSPDNIDPAGIEPNVESHSRRNSIKQDNMMFEESLTMETEHQIIKEQEQNNANGMEEDYEINAIHINEESQKQSQQFANSDTKHKGFQIVVTPAAETTNSETTGNTDEELQKNAKEFAAKRNAKIDPTLGGQIIWIKVADFTALLPENAKLKLWNGVFKEKEATKTKEIKRISKILHAFVMLHQTRECKKENKKVAEEFRTLLPAAVKEPAKFIANFLKKNEEFIDQTLLNIYHTISNKFQIDNAASDIKRAKHAKKSKKCQDNYAELTRKDLKCDFNKEDFLKTAFLQYMLYAFQIKLDTDDCKMQRSL